MTRSFAFKLILSLLCILLIVHLLILVQLLPYEHFWGGRLTNLEEMYVFESGAVVVTLLMLATFYAQYRLLQEGKSNKVLRVLIWIFFAYYLLNTLGNLMAVSIWEKILGTAFTLSMAGLTWKVLRGKE